MQWENAGKRTFKRVRLLLLSLVFLTACWLAFSNRHALALDLALPPAKESPQYQQLQKQPKTEMAKINYLFNRFSKAKARVIYDGHEYEMAEVQKIAKKYFYSHYHKETAEYWIKNYCYKTDKGNVIMFKNDDGQMAPVRDVILTELAAIQK